MDVFIFVGFIEPIVESLFFDIDIKDILFDFNAEFFSFFQDTSFIRKIVISFTDSEKGLSGNYPFFFELLDSFKVSFIDRQCDRFSFQDLSHYSLNLLHISS